MSGSTLYATLDRGGLRWNGVAFEAVALAGWTTYAVAMTEAAGTGFFSADVPAGIVTAGLLDLTVYKRAGGSPAATDAVVGAGRVDWDGSAAMSLASLVPTPADSGTAQAGTSSTVTLRAGSAAVTAAAGYRLFLTGGLGAGQDAPGGYDSTTKVFTAEGGTAWLTTPDATTGYLLVYSPKDLSAASVAAVRSGLSTYAGGAVASVTAPVTVTGTVDATLVSTGLDAIAMPALTGPATTFPGKVNQLWRRLFKGSAKDATGLTIKTFADNGTTVVTTQAYTDDGGGNETVGAAT